MRGRVIYGTKNRYFLEGVEVTQAEWDKAFPSKLDDLLEDRTILPANTKTCWPMRNKALAVHRRQVAEANARNKRHGVKVQYDADGTAIVPGRGEYRDLCKLEGTHMNDGGYGDA